MMELKDINLFTEKMRNGMREMTEACSVLKKQCDCNIFCPFATICEFSLAPNSWPVVEARYVVKTNYDEF